MVEFDGLKMLGDLTIARTYARTKEDGKKETWEEIVDRYKEMMLEKTPSLEIEMLLNECATSIKQKKVVPSMRALQFSNIISTNNIRAYNCSYMNMDCIEAFRELPYLLCCGVGVGVGILKEMVGALPPVPEGKPDYYCIEDSKEGWAYSIEYLMRNPQIDLDDSMIRPAGSPLSSGGTASGPEPLRAALDAIRKILQENVGNKLRPIHVLHIVCHIASAVVAGGVRRSAIISLFSADDEEVMLAKTGDWFNHSIHLSKSNNSAVIFKDSPNARERFDCVIDAAMSGWGEPAVIWSNGAKYNPMTFMGCNPCVEISLGNCGLCNLSEVIVPNCEDEEDFIQSCQQASFLGTMQATLTDFTFLRPKWAFNAKRDALIGVSLTGQAMKPELMTPEILSKAATNVVEMNHVISSILGIHPAKRATCTKPSGTTSACMGVTSGIHAAHSDYFIRRIRAAKLSPLGKHLIKEYGMQDKGFVEQCVYSDTDIVLSVPCKMEGALTRHEGALTLLDRTAQVYDNWVVKGHVEGAEKNNISLTVSYKDEEKEEVREWMWENRHKCRGISLLPYSGEYPQAPFEEITKEKYEELILKCPNIDVSKIIYDDGSRMQIAACAGGSCEVSF